MGLSEKHIELVDKLRKDLAVMDPSNAEAVAKMAPEQVLQYVEMSTIPALLGSWEQMRQSLLNLLIIVANVNQRDHFQPYIEGLDSINEYLESYQPSFLENCKHFNVIDRHGKAEVNGCTYHFSKNPKDNKTGDCNKHVCPMPNKERPKHLQAIECPMCIGKPATEHCALCMGMKQVMNGKICTTCLGKGAEFAHGEENLKTTCHVCTGNGINPLWKG